MKKTKEPPALYLDLNEVCITQASLAGELAKIQKSLKVINKKMISFNKFIDCRLDDGK